MVIPWHRSAAPGVSDGSYPDTYPEPPAVASSQPKVGTRDLHRPPPVSTFSGGGQAEPSGQGLRCSRIALHAQPQQPRLPPTNTPAAGTATTPAAPPVAANSRLAIAPTANAPAAPSSLPSSDPGQNTTCHPHRAAKSPDTRVPDAPSQYSARLTATAIPERYHAPSRNA